jgi:hypothetical protein
LAAPILLADCNGSDAARRMPDLRESYNYKDKRPFGSYIAYHQIEEMFYRNTVRKEKLSFSDSWASMEDTGSAYICFAGNLYGTDADVNSIIKFVKNGNDAFLAVNNFENALLEKLECKTQLNFSIQALMGKPYMNTAVKLSNVDTALYNYFYLPFSRYFSAFNKTNTKVLGVNENGEPNFIVIFKGKGRFFLHCEPRAFSNYFLLQKNNYQYMQKVFGYLKPYPDHIYWNDYYWDANNDRSDKGGTLSVILSYPPLAAAFWLSLLLLLAYILFGIKRRQRIIELVKRNENTTVTFTETIGRLYLQKKDNKNIADKTITYFNEYIRNNYFLNTNAINDDFVTTLSRKSGVGRDKVEALYRTINHAHNNAVVDDYQLLSLHEQIQSFYKIRN